MTAEHNIADVLALAHAKSSYVGVQDVASEVQRRKALLKSMNHKELRAELSVLGARNSFDGSTAENIRSMLISNADDGTPISPQLLCSEELRKQRQSEYARALEGVSLEGLALCLPKKLWKHYVKKGWLNVSLALSKKEKRLIALCHRVALTSLGVDPKDRATWKNAKHTIGYDETWGWLRSPANSLSQFYLATHPRVYRLYVGLYARLLLKALQERGSFPPGLSNEAEAIRCCLELRLQLYNTKIALPKSRDEPRSSFSHLDCDYPRGGCLETPAPQAFVACSPQMVDSTRVWSARFVDVEKAVEKQLAMDEESRCFAEGNAAAEAAAEVASASTDAADATTPPKQGVVSDADLKHIIAHLRLIGDHAGANLVAAPAETQQRARTKRRRHAPYSLPRKEKGSCTGVARREPEGALRQLTVQGPFPTPLTPLTPPLPPPPEGTDFEGPSSSGPKSMEIGEMCFFGHLVAHKVIAPCLCLACIAPHPCRRASCIMLLALLLLALMLLALLLLALL